MLTRIQEQLGLKGFSRVLLDSFEPDEFDRLVEECGLESQAVDSGERKALGLANLISSWPQLAAEVTRLLDTANREVKERIEGLADEILLNQFSPQNTDLEVPPGRLVWALLRCGERPACQDLLRIWVDFLARLAPASPDAVPAPEETHAINEKNVLEAERRAVARYAGRAEPSSQPPNDSPRRPEGGDAQKEMPVLEPTHSAQPSGPGEEGPNPGESSGRGGPVVRPVEGTPPIGESSARRDDEPCSAPVELAVAGELHAPGDSETCPAVADSGTCAAEEERLLERVAGAQEAAERRLEGIENRLDSLEALCQSLKQDLEAVRSEEHELLNLRIDQASSLLAAVREQTRLVQSRLETIPAVSRPKAEEPDLAGQPEEERPSSPEGDESGAERPAEDFSPPSHVEERSAKPVPAETEIPSAEATGHSEEKPEEAPALPDGEGQDEEQAEIAAGPGPQEAPSAPAPGGADLKAPMPPIEPIFQSETIILVGGHDHLAAEYEALIRGLGGRFERYASVDEFSVRWLEDLIDRAYLVVALGNVATQRGVMSLMEVANRLGRRFFVHHSAAPASLHQFLLRLVEGETI